MNSIKDTYIVNLGSGQTTDYTITTVDNNEVIYSGTAVKYPDAIRTEIELNYIVRDYLNSDVDSLSYNPNDSAVVSVVKNYIRDFVITTPTSSTTISMANNYDYNDSLDINNNCILSAHIRDGKEIADVRQFIPKNLLNYNTQIVVSNADNFDSLIWSDVSGNTYTLIAPQLTPATIKYTMYSGAERNVYVQNTCSEYVLYYLNALGGWDWLLVDGNTLRTDDMESVYYNSKFNNTKISTQYKNKYQSYITPKWECYINRLSDAESKKMYHLLTSQCIILHNMAENKMWRVNITNTDVKYYTYKNNQRHRADYTIELEASNYIIKRA